MLIDDQVADDERTSRAEDKAYSDNLLICLVRTACSVVHQASDDHDVPVQDGESPFDLMDEEAQAQIVCPLCSKYFKMTNRTEKNFQRPILGISMSILVIVRCSQY